VISTVNRIVIAGRNEVSGHCQKGLYIFLEWYQRAESTGIMPAGD